MPCYRCGARQTDPARGPSPWKRGVRDGVMVLVCPECQRDHPWAKEMDRCPSCGSTSLARALGQTTCKTCGTAVPDERMPGDEPTAPSGAPGLSDDVSAALARAFKRDQE